MARRNLTFRAAKKSCAGVALIFLGLATMVGCQGFSAAKPATTQPAQVGGLVLSGASLDFGSVTAGTSKTLTLSASNTSAAPLSIASVSISSKYFTLSSPSLPAVVAAGMTRSSFFRQQQAPARFKPGDRVRTVNINPQTHTRLPRYARDKVGTVERIHGCHAYPDSVATERGDDPQWLYTVVFDGREIWGPDADPTLKISIDAFEPYLEPA